jgi:glycosyltransferase involved in cell wall biosynthesis
MQTRIYGTKSLGSFEIVTTGLERAFTELDLFAGLKRLDKESDDAPGGTAPRGLLVGNPFNSKLMHFWGIHQENWLLLAPNSEGIPKDIVEDLSMEIFSLRSNAKVPTLTGLYAPTKWALGVLEREFNGQIPVRLLRHGVLDEYQPIPETRALVRKAFLEHGHFKVVHATSTWHERKGTRALIQAWKSIEEKVPLAELLITAPSNAIAIYQDVAAKAGSKRVRFMPNHSLTRKAWVEGISNVHAVVQPSRGEGFGLVPLEARACGLPVVATNCTGHSEHMPEDTIPGVAVIKHGGLTEVDDYPGAIAPTVTVESIRQGLFEMHSYYASHHDAALENAETIRKQWSWTKVTKEDLCL